MKNTESIFKKSVYLTGLLTLGLVSIIVLSLIGSLVNNVTGKYSVVEKDRYMLKKECVEGKIIYQSNINNVNVPVSALGWGGRIDSKWMSAMFPDKYFLFYCSDTEDWESLSSSSFEDYCFDSINDADSNNYAKNLNKKSTHGYRLWKNGKIVKEYGNCYPYKGEAEK